MPSDLTAVRQKVEQLLLDKDIKLQVSKDSISIPYESTRVFVLISPFGDDHSVVNLRGVVGIDVPISDELKCWVADKSAAFLFGHPAYFEMDGKAVVEFRHNLLADFLDPDELLTAVACVANTANDLDDEVHEKFGGRRFTDEVPPAQATPPAPPPPAPAEPPAS